MNTGVERSAGRSMRCISICQNMTDPLSAPSVIEQLRELADHHDKIIEWTAEGRTPPTTERLLHFVDDTVKPMRHAADLIASLSTARDAWKGAAEGIDRFEDLYLEMKARAEAAESAREEAIRQMGEQAVTMAAQMTFIAGADIPETIEAARLALVRRCEAAEQAMAEHKAIERAAIERARAAEAERDNPPRPTGRISEERRS